MTFFQEEILEPFARYIRFKKTLNHIPKHKGLVILDVGCGPKIRFYFFAKSFGIKLKKYIGLDPLLDEDIISKYKDNKSVSLVKKKFISTLNLKGQSVDCVISHAFLEHVENPSGFINESIRIVKNGGLIILTTPSPKSRKILEFLSLKLKLLSKREIEEHKNYFNKKTLSSLVSKNNLKAVKIFHKYFTFGLNNLFIIYR